MRRKDREVIDRDSINQIIAKCDCCRIAFADEDVPYILPMNFGFTEIDEKRVLYFHGAKEGKKIDLIAKNKRVGFEMDTDHMVYGEGDACEYSMKFQSIIGKGDISIVDDFDEKVEGLRLLMKQHTQNSNWEFNEKMVNAVCVFKIVVDTLTCKQHE